MLTEPATEAFSAVRFPPFTFRLESIFPSAKETSPFSMFTEPATEAFSAVRFPPFTVTSEPIFPPEKTSAPFSTESEPATSSLFVFNFPPVADIFSEATEFSFPLITTFAFTAESSTSSCTLPTSCTVPKTVMSENPSPEKVFAIVANGEFSLPLFVVSFPSGETKSIDFKTCIPNSLGIESAYKSLWE